FGKSFGIGAENDRYCIVKSICPGGLEKWPDDLVSIQSREECPEGLAPPVREKPGVRKILNAGDIPFYDGISHPHSSLGLFRPFGHVFRQSFHRKKGKILEILQSGAVPNQYGMILKRVNHFVASHVEGLLIGHGDTKDYPVFESFRYTPCSDADRTVDRLCLLEITMIGVENKWIGLRKSIPQYFLVHGVPLLGPL